MTIFQKQDLFKAALLENKLPNPIYKPYYDWKSGNGKLPTREQSMQIMRTSSQELQTYYDKYPHAYDDRPEEKTDDIWESYHGFGNDCRTVAFLESITMEVTNFLI